MNLLADFQTIGLILIHLLSWVTVGHILLNKKNPRAALGWAVAALFLPLIGTILYYLFGIARAESRAIQLMRNAKINTNLENTSTHTTKYTDHTVSNNIQAEFQNFALIGSKLSNRPLYSGNSISPLINGDEAYPQMLNAIENAKHHVYLTTYIFNAGDTATAFCKALCQAAKRGVDVRIIVDGLGARLYSLSWPWKKLCHQGVKVVEFLPPRLYPPNFAINLRNHRKILVADNIGFTGGMNISDNHLQSHKKFSVQDLHFLCSGPIVSQLHEAFLLDWGFCTNKYNTNLNNEQNKNGNVLCRMILDGPGSGKDPLHEILYTIMGAARKNIHLITPYFLPTHEVVGALKSAAVRGLDVRIILPEKNNLPYVHWASQHLLPVLLESGVRIFYQPPPFAHTKLLMIDGYYTQIGSANLDARSLRLNFELNVECFDNTFTCKMENYFKYKQLKSREYTMNEHQKLNLPTQLRNAACWLFSPYL